MKDPEDVSKLIGLKKYETPGEDYFAQFASDFKDRQRSEMLRQSSFALFRERLSMWNQQGGAGTWLVPAGAAAAAAIVAFGITAFKEEPSNLPANNIADLNQEFDVSLPPFPESSDEVIELKIPSPSEIPAAVPASRSPELLLTGDGGPLIEL